MPDYVEMREMEDGKARKAQKDYVALFRKFDLDDDGFIPVRELESAIRASGNESGLSQEQQDKMLQGVDDNKDKVVDFAEFCVMMSKAKNEKVQAAVFRAAEMIVPRSERTKELSYLQQYSCLPPPLFMIFISIAEISLYIVYVVEMDASISVGGPIPIYSPLIYDPFRRYQAWRYLMYMFIHIGIYHILFNILVQLCLGIPLELVHKFWRIMLVYVAGVLAGSLAVSVFDPKVFLAGASGGVYALMSAHVSNIIINWAEMEFALFRLVFISVMIVIDFGVAIYNRVSNPDSHGNKVSFVAHAGGFIAGFLMGIIVLRNLKKKTWETRVWYVALVLYILLMVFAILWNLVNSDYYYDQVYDPFIRNKTTAA